MRAQTRYLSQRASLFRYVLRGYDPLFSFLHHARSLGVQTYRRSCCLPDPISPLIHARSEKFQAADAARTGDLVVVTELREDGLKLAATAHLSWGQGLEALDGPGSVSILVDVPIRGNHGVVGCIGELQPGNQEGDGTLITALQDRGRVRSEPGPPHGIRERASL